MNFIMEHIMHTQLDIYVFNMVDHVFDPRLGQAKDYIQMVLAITVDITRRNFGWFRTFIKPCPYYDSSHWIYCRKSSMKEVLK